MDPIISRRIEEWTRSPFDGDTIGEIEFLRKENNEKELVDRFYTTLEFGTGGLRGVIGAGTNRMNIYTVGMATQGLANYVALKGGREKGVVIARDSRRMSDAFAREAASILAGNGVRVYLFEDITPTPFCSFAIRELGAGSGIVLTASHNPPEYNGYKVYWDDGGQIVPPHDGGIIGEVLKIESIGDIRKTDFEEGKKSGLIRMIGPEILRSYIARLEGKALRPPKASGIKIVYSPLHGTGYRIVPEVLAHFGFTNLHAVKEQSVPDGNFPTVKYPNPEEKEAMSMALDLARAVDADLLMATDPDADRMGIGFKDGDGGYRLITGNQIGTMLEYYLLSRLKEAGRLPEGGVVVKTIVTTDLQEDIARSFRCGIDSVLTGFKWIAMKMKEYEETGARRFIFGGEESYGYLPVDFVRDKDAVSSCYFFAEMADWLAGQNRTLVDFLDGIYRTYGLYEEDLHSLTLKGLEGIERIRGIMAGFRERPPAEFAGIEVVRSDDIKSLKTRDLSTGKEEPIGGLPASDVVQFFLGDGTKITVRPSGTEPKIKFYFSASVKVGLGDMNAARAGLKERIARIRKDLLEKINR